MIIHLPVRRILLFSCAVFLGSIIGCSSGEGKTESILVYCGAGMSKPMDEIGRVFLEQHGVEVRYNYAGSNTLLNQMELTREGDVYMPGATMYIEIARDKRLVNYSRLVCYHIPVIIVPGGNPAGITCLQDLGKPGIRLIWSDPEAAAIGRTGKEILEKNGIYDLVWPNVMATLPTMNEVMM